MNGLTGTPSHRLAPHPVSGVMDCPGRTSFQELVRAAERAGWSADGIQPEPAGSTLAALLERRQPRPTHWGCGLLAERCCRLVAARADGPGYASIRAPRKASGPDLAYLFIGGEREVGTIERVGIALVRPASRYLVAEGVFSDAEALFGASRALSLLDPLGIRRLDWDSKGLSAYLPLRATAIDPMRRAVEALGLETEVVSAPPETARYAEEEPPPPRLHLSAPYAVAGRVLAEAEARRGRRRLVVQLRYPDAHGVCAIFGTAKAGFEVIEALYEAIVLAGDADDAFLVDPDGAVVAAEPRLFAARAGDAP